MDQGTYYFDLASSHGNSSLTHKTEYESGRDALALPGIQFGHNKRMRDLITWVKKKRRHIRKDELLAFVCGKPPPPVKTQRHSPPRCRLGSRSHSDRGAPRSPTSIADSEPDLTPFQNALAIQGL